MDQRIAFISSAVHECRFLWYNGIINIFRSVNMHDRHVLNI